VSVESGLSGPTVMDHFVDEGRESSRE